MILILLALIDVHTLFVLIFHNYLSTIYVFSGSSFAILKGLIFYLPNRDIYSLLDMITGIIMLFLLVIELWSFLWWIIALFLIYKIILSFSTLV